ncbi:replication/maintenance protein RepL [Candidatus Enterovibrio escicola]|uniref:replication/maintenance protein RepL n=1 Tax=Candidatus Enterovibrio escicola TaxID=1927127 RepID=UPI0012383364|nr:replication/maintenance protein RepL [Candidatus Enterovibrio escacola]
MNNSDSDYFNPATYEVRDKITGEILDVSIFIERAKQNGWEKAYAKTLGEYIKCGGGQATEFLAYILEKKDPRNMLYGTQREFAAKTGVSLPVINKTMKALEQVNLIKKVRSGAYMLSPNVIRNGSNKTGVILFRLWKDV